MKQLSCIMGILLISIMFCLLTAYGEIILVSNKVVPPAGIRLPEWLNGFKHWAIANAVVAGASSLLWYILGQWFSKLTIGIKRAKD